MKIVPPELLDEAVDRLVKEFDPEAIYLFGSHAWGAPTQDSDVDFFVIVPNSQEQPIRRAQRGHRCLRGLGMPKDVLVETVEEVQGAQPSRASLEHQVLARGRNLYARS